VGREEGADLVRERGIRGGDPSEERVLCGVIEAESFVEEGADPLPCSRAVRRVARVWLSHVFPWVAGFA
ncbi:MAG TPA: hypothetical protein VFV24_04055, partial [Candidatus Eisenbacteria bacterium]|nr:hypothetical protein [Candidatus Eisenbacteria bacterium]